MNQSGRSLAAMTESGLSLDASTELLARFLSKTQNADGHWYVGLPRIPLSSSDFTTTACAIRSIQAYAPPSEVQATVETIRRAAAWLEKTKPLSTEDKAFRLQGLKWAGADRKLVEGAVKMLKEEQNRDGGWAQMPGFNSDAYATGEVLVALRESGDVAIAENAFQRGIEYLLQTQEKDGSWLVHKRAVPFNGYLETGFPHGKFQISSFSGTCWASMALMLAEPVPARDGKP
jgi:squalene cyclase